MSESWRPAELGSLSSLITSGSRGWAEFYADSGAAFLRITNLTRTTIRPDLTDLKRVQLPSGQAEGSRTRVKPGDILISITADLGIIGVAPNLGEAYVNQHIALVRPTEGLVPDFVGYYLAGPGQSQFSQLNDAGAKAGLNLGSIRKLHVLVPPLNEQRRIAAILSSVDDAIEATQAVIDQLQVVKKAMMAELLTRGLPGRHTRFRQTEVGEVPETWQVVPLGSLLAAIDAGWSPLCDSVPAGEDEWGVLKVSAVSWGEFRPYENKRLPVHLRARPQAEVRDGDLLVSRANTPELVGRCVLVRETRPKLMLSDKLMRLRVSPANATAGFVRLVMETPCSRQQIEDGATGSSRTMKNISQEKLRSILVPQPTLEEQRAIAGSFDVIGERTVSEQVTLNAFRTLKTALMSVLLTGEVRVKPDEDAA